GRRQPDPELRHVGRAHPVDSWTPDRPYRAAVRLFAGRGMVAGLSGSGEAAAGSSPRRGVVVPVGDGSALPSCGVAPWTGAACGGAAGAGGTGAAAARLSG